MMTITAPAKINLYLAVEGKRSDGYHELHTILHRISLHDVIEIEPADRFSLETKGIKSPETEENLVLKAARLYSRTFGTPAAKISLYKNIPVGAGLGGGSSDAAATLKALRRIYRKGSDAELIAIGETLGADVPFFFKGQTAYATGIGTQVTTLPSVDLGWIVLVKPPESLLTADVYGELKAADYKDGLDSESILRAFYENDISTIGDSLYNSLEAPAFRILPKLKALKNKLVNLGGKTLLSGSGSTIYSLFDDEGKAKDALVKMKPYSTWSGLFRSGVMNEEN